MNKTINLQDMMLNNARKEGVEVQLYLVSGLRFVGHIKGFDNFVVILSVKGKKQMIYKHAISTIIPNEDRVFAFDNGEENAQ